jgi:ABC-type uncharacterized transport system involved in gliding motility auxiliary subunit
MGSRLRFVIGIAALGMLGVGVAVDLSLPGKWYALALYGAGAALAVLWTGVARHAILAWLRRRSTKMGAHSVLLVAVFAAVLVLLNILAFRHDPRLDLSQTGAFTLAPQSVKVLEGMKDDVKVTAFVQKGSESESKFRDLLDTYRHYSTRISGETIDPDAHPAAAKQFGITQSDTIVVESGGQEARIRSVSEQELTNALIRVGKKDKKRIAILDGHGEPAITDTEANGLSQAKDALEREGYEVSSLLLAQRGTVPPGTTAVIVADPQKALLPKELDALKAYLASGGGVLLLLGPGPKTGLEELAAQQWGVTFRGDTVIDADPFSRLAGGDYTRPIIRTYGDHEIVKDFRLATSFSLAQSLTFQTTKAPQIDYRPLAFTSQDSWGETQIVGGKARFDAGQDAQGPLDLAAAVTPKASTPVSGDEGGEKPSIWRAVVVGNAGFATNRYFNMLGNGDLLTSSVNWLAEDQTLIAIRPKEASSSPLLLTAGQQRVVFWVPVVLVPGVITVYGFGVWRRRRRL